MEGVTHETYQKVLSNMAFKGKVKLPLIAQIEDYSKIVVLDQNNKLKIADKPASGQNNNAFSFSGFITSSSKDFPHIFPSQFHGQGHYLVSAELFFNYAKSGMFCVAYRKIKFPILVAMPILNFQQIPGNLDIIDHRGAFYEASGGSIIDSGIINLTDINMSLSVSRQVELSMSHNFSNMDNFDFSATVNIINTY